MKTTISIVSILAMAAVIGAIVIGNMSFDGTVTESPYETGLMWDEIQKERVASGLTIRLNKRQFKKGRNIILFQIEKTKPANIDSITIKRSRPSTDDFDKEVPVTLISDEKYQAGLDFPLVGSWDLIATVKVNGKDILFSNRIHVRE